MYSRSREGGGSTIFSNTVNLPGYMTLFSVSKILIVCESKFKIEIFKELV